MIVLEASDYDTQLFIVEKDYSDYSLLSATRKDGDEFAIYEEDYDWKQYWIGPNALTEWSK